MPYKDPERRREYDRERSQLPHRRHKKRPRNPARYQAWWDEHPNYQAEWRAAHPGYRAPGLTPTNARAIQTVRRKVRSGALVKTPCEMCGSTIRVQGHHAFGYEPEFAASVWWLCVRHHAKMHKFIRAQK